MFCCFAIFWAASPSNSVSTGPFNSVSSGESLGIVTLGHFPQSSSLRLPPERFLVSQFQPTEPTNRDRLRFRRLSAGALRAAAGVAEHGSHPEMRDLTAGSRCYLAGLTVAWAPAARRLQ